MKTLYGFELEDNGKKIEFAIKRPTRVDKEEADLVYSEHYSRCITRGIVTKAMLANRYTDAGGSVSHAETKRYNDLFLKWVRTEESLAEERKRKRDKDKDKISTLEEDIINLKEELVQFYSRQQRLFEHTAEAKAEAQVILWYVLMLSYVRYSEDDELEPYFIGETFDDKLEYYDEQEEKAEDLFLKAVEKLTIYLSLYYYNGVIKPEDFKAFEENLEKERSAWEEEVEESEEEIVEEKAEKEEAKKDE